MARRLPTDYPPPASPDDESSSEGIRNTGDEEEEEKTPLKKRKTYADKAGSDTEYDSDKSFPSPNISDFTIKPIVSKPNKSVPKPKHSANESSSKRKRPSSSASDGGSGGKCLQLSKKIWGNETNEKRNKTQKKKKNLSSEDGSETELNGGEYSGFTYSVKDNEHSTQISSGNEEDNVDFWKDYPLLKQSFLAELTKRFGVVAGYYKLEDMGRKADAARRDKFNEMERKEKKQKIVELELFLNKAKFAQEIAEAKLKAIKETGI